MLSGCGGDSSTDADQPISVNARVVVELRYPLIADALDTEAKAPEQCAGGLDYAKILGVWRIQLEIREHTEGRIIGSLMELASARSGFNPILARQPPINRTVTGRWH